MYFDTATSGCEVAVDVAGVGASTGSMPPPLREGIKDHDVLFAVTLFGGVARRRMVLEKPLMNRLSSRVSTRLLPMTVGPLVIRPCTAAVALKVQAGSVIGGVVVVSRGITIRDFGPHSLPPAPAQETAML